MADYTGSLEIFGRNFQRGEMKAILEFDLPDESIEFKDAIQGSNWKGVVWDLDQFLRNKLKHGHSFQSADEALEAIREELLSILDAYGLLLEG